MKNQTIVSQAIVISEREPNQPSIREDLQSKRQSSRNKTTNTFKSQDDIEPEMPNIASEY